MQLQSHFDRFRQATQPSEHQKAVMLREHTRLREFLDADRSLQGIMLGTFIQGSHRRATAIRGSEAHPCDVDIVAVTRLSRSASSARHAHDLFRPFLERNYKGRYSQGERSWCITVDPQVTIDLVPTAEPESPEVVEAVRSTSIRDWIAADDNPSGNATESDWNRALPLWIPDRRLEKWEHTHPILLIRWTAAKNARSNGRFTHVVRAIKWWKRHTEPSPEYPKGYPLEHMVAECCPNAITSIAEGITTTLETMASRFRDDALRRTTPQLPARGAPEVNVMRRIDGADFARFHGRAMVAAQAARRALNSTDEAESVRLWSGLLGPTFR